MEVKTTLVGVLIYATMAAYLVAAVAFFRGAKRVGRGAFLAAFVAGAAAFATRWIEVAHVPLQNLFEVFLTLGMLLAPLSLVCERYLKVRGGAADAIIGIITLFPAGFVFHAEPQQLPPALQSDLFIPHVAAYMISYMLLAKAAIQAGAALAHRRPAGDSSVDRERATYAMVKLGFPLLTIGLVLGAVWGKVAWGDYWNWDPKELWSFASWLVFVGYLHFRATYGRRFPRANSILVIAGMAAIVCTLLWVNLSRVFTGLHSYAS